MHQKNKKYFSRLIICQILAVFVILSIYSCSSTKYVPENKFLLNSYKVKVDKKKIKDEEFKSYLKPKLNKEVLYFKLYLFFYNLSKKGKENWLNRSLRTIGEEPVLYDEFQSEKTRNQLELYLNNKGYYDAVVTDTIQIDKRNNKKLKVIYEVDENEPYRIGSISYSIEDSTLEEYIYRDTSESLLKNGERFDVDVLASERERIENLIKNKGYYKFSKEEHLFFEADSTIKSKIINVRLILKKFREINSLGLVEEIGHPRYKIREVNIYTNYQPLDAVNNLSSYSEDMDTLSQENINIIYSGHPNIKSNVIVTSTFINPDDYYNKINVNLSYKHLISLEVFRLVNIQFVEPEDQAGKEERVLDCIIQLTPFLLQSYTIEPEITNSSGNIGGGGNLIYQHRNLFMGAENFNFRLKGAVEAIKKTESKDLGNIIELGAETTLKIPKFLLPFRTDQFIKKFNPKTSFTLAYNYQERPEYTRTIANMSFGYNWRGNKNLTHNINPIELNLIRIPEMSPEFSDWLQGKYISFSYQPHMVSITSYSLTFTNQKIQTNRDFIYVKYNAESAGNILNSFYKISGLPKNDGVYEIFNIPFAQYLRSDIDFRYYNIIDENSSLVYRIFAGAGVPYKNSTALPFEKKYFSGGANSIRAWQVRNLGPGSHEDLDPGLYPNKTADIKLEGNIEYRFKLFWLLKGAFFIDVGNIWAVNSKDERSGAVFKINKFYKEIAVGTGFGTRFDFSFFIFRFDLGIKIKDPVYPEGQRWVIGNRNLERKDFVYNFGIGYPF